MITTRSFEESDRYRFDIGECSSVNGFCQCDTRQDAWYFGIWVNPVTRQIVTYCEGDVCRTTCETDAEFAAEVRRAAEFYRSAGYGFVIDAHPAERFMPRLSALGISDLATRGVL